MADAKAPPWRKRPPEGVVAPPWRKRPPEGMIAGPWLRSSTMTATWHLAQFNIARMKFPVDSAEMADFVNALDPINALGEASEGFVWRHTDDTGSSTNTRIFDDPELLINFTVWESVDALWNYAYKSGHVEFLRRRREWFVPLAGYPVTVLWWTPADTVPTVDEATKRLESLRDNGPTSEAFTFRQRFDPPGDC